MKQMREFKFRAWHRGIPKRIRYSGTPAQMLYDEKPGECLIFLNQGQDIEQVMQFTGLKDKNGIEIYEGDLIKADHGYVKYSGEVVFDEGSFCLKINNSPNGYDGHAPDYDNGQTPELNNFDSIEVIGNIYEMDAQDKSNSV